MTGPGAGEPMRTVKWHRNPREPEASVKSVNSSEVTMGVWMIDTPFQVDTNLCHQRISSRASESM